MSGVYPSGRVVHVMSGQCYDLYVGRPMPRQNLAGSTLANPYRIRKGLTKDESLELYEVGIRAFVESYPEWRERVLNCQGLSLACWCAPEDGYLTAEDDTVCHAQILLRLADELTVTS